MGLSKENRGSLFKWAQWGLSVFSSAVYLGPIFWEMIDYCRHHVFYNPESYILRGTEGTRLLGNITGIPWIDYFLNSVIAVYWECVSGNDPTLSIIFCYTLGQSIPVLLGVFLDGHKVGNQGRWMYTGTYMSSVLHIHPAVTTSPVIRMIPETDWADQIPLHLADSITVALLPLSLVLGYVVPGIAMALRSKTTFHERQSGLCPQEFDKGDQVAEMLQGMFECDRWWTPFQRVVVSNEFKQWAILAWFFHPLWIGAFQVLLRKPASWLQFASHPSPAPPSKRAYTRATRFVYAFGITVGFLFHIAIATISFTAASGHSRKFFPRDYHHYFSPKVVFFWTYGQDRIFGPSFVDIVHEFIVLNQRFVMLQLVLLAFMGCTHGFELVGRPIRWRWFMPAVAAGWWLAGPGTTFLAIGWARDEAILGHVRGEKGAAKSTAGDKEQGI